MRQKVEKKKWKRIFEKWKEVLFALFFPRCCPVCDEAIPYGQKICNACEKKVPLIKEPACKKCGKQLENERQEYCGDCSRKKHCFLQGKAIFSYQKEMKLSMYRFKYANKREYADYFAEVAIWKYRDWITRIGVEVIVPIPMFWGKMWQRGYNQAEVFAKALGRELELPVESRFVYRVKNTVPQKELNDRQRKDNLKGAFQVRTNIVKYRKILLIDDIYTTGTTVDAVGEVLKTIGVEEIYFLCICIGEGY
ncbi:MAG: ComF family protein [Roseburia sp.]|nr:ComF family protein [Roseburia sp.]